MNLPEDLEFSIVGVGAIIEKELNGIRHVLIQNRIRIDDCTQNHLIEIPCGKVRKKQNIFNVLKYRVKEETGLIITDIIGQRNTYDSHPNYYIQGGKPFYICQNVEQDFPVCIIFYICTASDDNMKSNSTAATDIRWISIDDLEQMLKTKKELFFPLVYEALKEYVYINKNRI